MTMFKMKKGIENPEKIAIKIDIDMLNIIIGYCLQDSKNVTKKNLFNAKLLFNVIDDRVFQTDEKLLMRVELIRDILDSRLVKGMEKLPLILNQCKPDIQSDTFDEIYSTIPQYMDLNYDEICSVTKQIYDRVTYSYSVKYKDMVYRLVEKFDTGEYHSFEEINTEMYELFTRYINESRKVASVNSSRTFSLGDGFEESVSDIVTKLKNPSKMFVTGIKKLNEVLSPAFMSQRVYLFAGTPGGFKSGILLKTLRDIKQYNKDNIIVKPGKQAVALLVTMENSVEESVERLFNMTVTPDDIRDYSPEEVISLLREKGELTLQEENDIDIIIKYFPNRSISTADLYTIIEELNDDNKEVVTLTLDYIKRIRPEERGKDEKEELKNITNELKNLAIEYDIPVITAHQLNRNAASTIDAAMQDNKEDVARFIGRGAIGSAWEIMENVDWCCFINVEQKRSTGQYYLTFKRVKIRYRVIGDELGYFNHPFDSNNRMRLVDDFDLEESLSEASLSESFEGVPDDKLLKRGNRQAKTREILEEDDIFDFNNKSL